jgi:hypothetical protein
MVLIYASNVEGEKDLIIPTDEFKRLVGCSLTSFIELTGIQAIHNIEDLIQNGEIFLTEYQKQISLFITTDVVQIKLTMLGNGILHYGFLRIFKPFNGNHYGKSIFYTAVEKAKSEGFKELKFEAHGNRTTLDHPQESECYIGYFAWIDPQIKMENPTKYEAFLKDKGIPVMPLYELYKSDKVTVHSPEGKQTEMTGREFWIENGRTWRAKIDLPEYQLTNVYILQHAAIKVVSASTR